jgi:hypothetical protein
MGRQQMGTSEEIHRGKNRDATPRKAGSARIRVRRTETGDIVEIAPAAAMDADRGFEEV